MGSSTKIESPQVPQQNIAGNSIADLIKYAPQLMALQQQYSPQSAALDYQIQQQYAPQFSALQKSINDSLYPQTGQLQEKLAGQALQYAEDGMPESMKKAYQDQFRAEIGQNVGSGIGSDYVSRNMLNQNEQYKNYYQNLGLSLAGRQPLGTYSPTSYQNMGEGFNYGTMSGAQTSAYGNMLGAYGSMYGTNADLQARNYASKMQLYGSLAGAGGAMGAAKFGA